MMPKPSNQAPVISDPDLVDRIFEYLISEFPQIAGQKLEASKRAVREEFRGERPYVPLRGPTEQQELVRQVLSLFNGRNASEVARRLQISRATVYRLLKQSGFQKTSLKFAGNETGKPIGLKPAGATLETDSNQD